MRKHLLLTFSILALKLSPAQVYTPFPEEKAYWQVGSYPMQPPPIYFDQYFLPSPPNDTTINSNVYKKLYKGVYPVSYVAAIRQNISAKQVFILPKDSANEYILYDFSKNVGDTIYNIYCLYLDYHPIIYHGVVSPPPPDSIVEIFPDISIKKMQITSIWTSSTGWQNDGFSTFWLEHVGGYGGILANAPFGSVSGDVELLCMSYNDTVRWPLDIGGEGTCKMISGIEENQAYKSLKIYPNPFSNITTIEVELPYNITSPELVVYDVLGAKVKTYSLSKGNNKLSINAKDYSEGVYIYTIIGNNMILDKKKIFVVK